MKYGFFDAEGGDGAWDRTYTAEDFTDYLGTMISSGVQRGYENEFAFVSVSQASPHCFVVNSGKAWIKGRYIVSDGTNDIYYNQEAYEPTGASTYWLCLCAYCSTKDRECGVKFVYLGDEYYRPVDTSTEFYVPLYAVQVNYDGSSYSVLDYNDVREYAGVSGGGESVTGGTTDYGTISVDDGVVTISDGYVKGSKENLSILCTPSFGKAATLGSVVIGYGASANGDGSAQVAIGFTATSSGERGAVAIGSHAKSSGEASIAIGGVNASESGGGVTASEKYSIAIGHGISTTAERQIVLGAFPKVSSDYKLIIGDGKGKDAGEPHNLLTIDNDGIMEINGSAVNTLMVPKDDYDALVARVEALEAKLGG